MKNKIAQKNNTQKIISTTKLKEFEIKEKSNSTITVIGAKKDIDDIKATAKKYNLKYNEYLIKCHRFYCEYVSNIKNNSKKNIK